MKVLQILAGGAWGGGSAVVHPITRALIEQGDEVWVVVLDEVNAREFAAIGATVVRPPLWFRALQPLDVVPFVFLYRLCRRERFDLVVAHTSKGGFLGRFAARLAGVKHIIYHAHAYYFNQMKPGPARSFFLVLEKLAAKAGDLTISVSEEHRQSAIREGVEVPGRIITVLNGVDPRPFQGIDRDEVRRELGVRRGELLIGSTGRLAPDKGIEYLLQTMPAILARFPSARLMIAGEGPLAAALQRETALLGLEDRVRFLGFRSDVPRLLTAFDIFVLPSLREGLSISLIEALAAGNVTVACRIPGNREIITHGDNGLLVPPADAAALGDAICRLLADPVRARELGARAREVARVRFSLDRMVAQNLEAYHRLVSPRTAGARPDELVARGAVVGRPV